MSGDNSVNQSNATPPVSGVQDGELLKEVFNKKAKLFRGRTLKISGKSCNRADLIKVLNKINHDKPGTSKLKKGRFFGIIGGSSKKEIRKIFEETRAALEDTRTETQSPKPPSTREPSTRASSKDSSQILQALLDKDVSDIALDIIQRRTENGEGSVDLKNLHPSVLTFLAARAKIKEGEEPQNDPFFQELAKRILAARPQDT